MNYHELQQAIIKQQTEMPCESAPDLFFPTDGERDHFTHLKAAKQLCAECPIQLACLDYAIDNNETYGIWGGTTHQERKRLTRRQRRMVK